MPVQHRTRRGKDEKEQPVHSEQVYRLKLKPPDDPNFSPSVQILESEYGTRYLEGLGVAPSRSTLDLVHKNVPLSQKCVNTTLRAKGHVNDEIQITVPPLTHQPKVPQVINPHAVLQLGLNTQEAGVLGSDRVEDAQVAADAAAGKLPEAKHVPGSKFRLLAAKFLHPFNLDVNAAQKQLKGLLHSMGSRPQNTRAATAGAQEGRQFSRPTKSMQRSTSVSMLQKSQLTKQIESMQGDDETPGQEVRKIQTLEELLQDLIVTPEVILVLQTQIEGALLEWHTHTAAETLKNRLSDEEFKATLELLVSDSSIEFFITLMNFMHEEFLRSSPSFPHDLVQKLRRESAFNLGGSSRGQFSKSLSRRASFINGAAGGNAVKPIKQLATFAEHDLGWRVWSAERDYQCKQAEIEAEREAANLEAMKFSSSSGGLYSNSAPKLQHNILTNPTQASFQAFSSSAAHPNSSGLALPEALRPAHQSSPSTVPSQTSTAMQTSSRTHHQAQPGSGVCKTKRASISFGPTACFPAKGTTSHDPNSMFDTQSHSSSSSCTGTPRDDQQSHPETCDRRVKPVSTLKHLDPDDVTELQQARLFVLQREFNALYKKLRTSRAGLSFTLPVFLVASRLLVYLLFTCLFRLWVQSDEGAEALEKMDKAIVYLFDPSGYLQRNLTILESTPAAVSIMAKHHQLGHGPERVHMSDVSPLMRAAMQQPASHQARKLLVDGAKHRLSRHTSTTNRVVNAAGAAALAGAEVPLSFSFLDTLPAYQQQQQQMQGQLTCPLHTKLTLEQTDALYREAHAGVLESIGHGLKPAVGRKRDICIP